MSFTDVRRRCESGPFFKVSGGSTLKFTHFFIEHVNCIFQYHHIKCWSMQWIRVISPDPPNLQSKGQGLFLEGGGGGGGGGAHFPD